MQHTARVEYNEALIRDAARAYIVDLIGWRGALIWCALLVVVVYEFSLGDRSWLLGVNGAVVVLAAGIGAVLYFNAIRGSLARLARMPSPEVDWTFTETGLTVRSAMSYQELSWSLIGRVSRRPRVWMMYLGGTSFSALPTAAMDAAAQAFIVEHVKSHGGYVGG